MFNITWSYIYKTGYKASLLLFTNLLINIVLGMSPTAFRHVPGESINQPIVAIKGKATCGKPYKETIKASPINPPPGIPDITAPDNTATSKANNISDNPLNDMPNTENKNAILSIDAMEEPSMCIVAPIGNTTFDTSSDRFIFLAVFILDGNVASEEHVPSDVIVESNIFLYSIFIPSFLYDI